MRWRLGGRLLVVALAAAALAGCSKNPAAPSNMQSAEQLLVTNSIDSTNAYTSENVYGNNSGDVAATRVRPGAGPASIQAAISPLHFWRTFLSITSAYSFAFGDPDTAGRPLLAQITVSRAIRGAFHIVPGTPGDTTLPDTSNIVVKPFLEGSTRRLLFHRVQRDTLGLEWRLVAVSGIRVSRPTNTVHIVGVELHGLSSGKDTTYTDPGLLMPLREVPRFSPGDSVVVTVTSLRNDDVAVLYLFDHRVIMHNNGDDTYTWGFNAGSFSGWHHVGINVMTHGTLYDDTLPYDSETWILPFAITSSPVVDYLP